MICEGQAVWRPKIEAPEIAGELLVATHRNGETFLQFTKTPLPFVVARITTNRWLIENRPSREYIADGINSQSPHLGIERPPTSDWVKIIDGDPGVSAVDTLPGDPMSVSVRATGFAPDIKIARAVGSNG